MIAIAIGVFVAVLLALSVIVIGGRGLAEFDRDEQFADPRLPQASRNAGASYSEPNVYRVDDWRALARARQGQD